jgi:hypothetical protein
MNDRRERRLGKRLIVLESPASLPAAAQEEFATWCHDRITSDDPDVPWRTIPQATEEADNLLEKAATEEEEVAIRDVRQFIQGLGEV